METEFTPFAALLGGGLIGLGTVGLMALLGRIMGATGILAGALDPAGADDRAWRLAVIGGMVTAPVALFGISGKMAVPNVTLPPEQLLIGGFLVGVGVTFGSGCTSGHGICGVARLSARSIVATATFMATTAATVYVVRHGPGG